MNMRRLRIFGILVIAALAAPGIASLAGAKGGVGGGGGGGGGGAVAGANFKVLMTEVAGLPACVNTMTNTAATPPVCQTAFTFLAAPGVAAATPVVTVQGTKVRMHVAGLDPVLFPLVGCTPSYRIGSLIGSTPLVAPVAPEVGNLADFRTAAPVGTIKSGDTVAFDLVCNFTSGAILGRRGVVVTPGSPVHTETHWAGTIL